VALVDTLYRFDLKSPNGYTIKVTPVEKTFTILENRTARVKYQAEFYKPGTTTPFETIVGDESFDPRARALPLPAEANAGGDGPSLSYRPVSDGSALRATPPVPPAPPGRAAGPPRV
jgi:hypothetical protein